MVEMEFPRWRTRDGRSIAVPDLADDHIIAILKCAQSNRIMWNTPCTMMAVLHEAIVRKLAYPVSGGYTFDIKVADKDMEEDRV